MTGADITDYFNYGFNEETWQQYCDKQKAMRALTGGATNRTFSVSLPGSIPKQIEAVNLTGLQHFIIASAVVWDI